MLQRYKELPTAISPHPSMIKVPAHPDDEVVAVENTYAFVFASGSKRAPRIEVCVGRVHMLIAAVSGSKVANDAAGSKRGKRSLNYFMSVPKADTTALYLCHPYACNGDSRWGR
jgi:hypothetical protein